MSRLRRFSSLFGENWLIGTTLLAELKRLGEKENGVLLDLACGESPFRGYFPAVAKYIRVDRSPKDSEVIPGDMLAIPLEARSVDIVLLFQAITDVPYPASVFNEVRRVLQPGGRLVVLESMAYPEHDAPHDFYRLMPEGLRVLGRDSGFAITSFVRLGGLFSRFALLWCTYIMGAVKRHDLFRFIAYMGIAIGNIVFYCLDWLFPHPLLASDYLAVLTLNETKKDNETSAVACNY